VSDAAGRDRDAGAEVVTRPVKDENALCCLRCGFPVASRAWGCKNPCGNCGVVYPLGDCSD